MESPEEIKYNYILMVEQIKKQKEEDLQKEFLLNILYSLLIIYNIPHITITMNNSIQEIQLEIIYIMTKILEKIE
jgi:hypothetical protein